MASESGGIGEVPAPACFGGLLVYSSVSPFGLNLSMMPIKFFLEFVTETVIASPAAICDDAESENGPVFTNGRPI